MEKILNEILQRLEKIEKRLDDFEKDITFLKLEATDNNVSLKGMEKLIEETADKVFNIYDDTKEIKKIIG